MTLRVYQCPVCGQAESRDGKPFWTEAAVAWHIAGKILWSQGNKRHEEWARKQVPDINLELLEPEMARALYQAVHDAVETEDRGLAGKASLQSPSPSPLDALQRIERQLHQHIKRRLQAKFGDQGESWWVSGIPLKIRKECVTRREEDPSRDEPYSYTDLIDLKEILDKNWPLFEMDLLRVHKEVATKKDLLDLLFQLNTVRNSYAHPVRAPEPESEKYSEDLSFAARATEIVKQFCRTEDG
jgi:hypothetical protein